MPIIRAIKAHHGETVEIEWTLADGSKHVDRVTCPPGDVVKARQTGNAEVAELNDGAHVVPRAI